MSAITTYYRSKDNGTIVQYIDGAFHSWTNLRADKISVEALRHDIAMFEEELNFELFEKMQNTITDLPPLNEVVEALCEYMNGTFNLQLIRRIFVKDNSRGWNWSHPEIKTTSNCKVLCWSSANSQLIIGK